MTNKLGPGLRDQALAAREEARAARRDALRRDPHLGEALANLLLHLGVRVIAPRYENEVIHQGLIFRAARDHADHEPRLQLLGHCPECNEEVWSASFTSLVELGEIVHTFAPSPEHAQQCPAKSALSPAEQLAAAIRRVVTESGKT